MLNILAFIGEPLCFKEHLYIYPPTIKEVVTNPNFNLFYKILTMTQDDINEELKDKIKEEEEFPTPFEYLMLSSQYVDGFGIVVKKAFQYFCKLDVKFSLRDNTLILSDFDNQCVINLTAEEFFNFQNTLREACGDKPVAPPEPIDPDEDPRVRRIKELARYRERVKARRGSKDGISLNTCLTAICCMGIGITPLNIGEMSYAAVGPLMRVMQDKEKYDIDIRSLLAGADSKKVKPKYWIRNSEKE